MDDIKNGYGIIVLKILGEEKFLDGNHYKGYFINGQKNGKGQFFLENGTFYEGEFKDDKLHGYVSTKILLLRAHLHGLKLRTIKVIGEKIH